MTLIEASSVRVSTLADGTMRLTVDVEPRHAQSAFALFGMPGTPMALAALAVGHAAKSDEPAPEEQKPEKRRAPTTKPIAQWLAMRCAESAFQNWVCTQLGIKSGDAEVAAEWCRTACGVQSRGDIDGNAKAEALFREHIQGPWSKHYMATH